VRYRIVSPALAQEFFFVHPTTGALFIRKTLAENQVNNSYDVSTIYSKFIDIVKTMALHDSYNTIHSICHHFILHS